MENRAEEEEDEVEDEEEEEAEHTGRRNQRGWFNPENVDMPLAQILLK